MRAAGDVDEVASAAAQAAWKHVVGSGLQSQTVVTGLQEKRLLVAVADGIWRRQLESMSGQLLYRLNAALGTGTIQFIEFRIDPMALPERAVKTKDAKEPVSSETIATELLAAAASIKKPDLRRAFLAAAGSSLRGRNKRTRSDNS